MAKEYRVIAQWDEEAQVWWAESEEVPGLCVEAASFEALEQEIALLIPELLLENGVIQAQGNEPIRFRVLAEKAATTRLAA
jgi:predicted RNase H-like HicB family nuclease